MPIQIRALDHFVLTVRNVEATCAFYSGALGIAIDSFGEGRKALRLGNLKINLHEVGHEHPPVAGFPTPGSGDLCFITATPLSDVIASLNERGIVVEAGPVARTGTLGPIQSIYLRDPDSNLVEISNYV